MIRRLLIGGAIACALSLASASGPVPSAFAASCDDHPNQASAQRAKDTRDPDGDGIYCEWNDCPCLKPGEESRPAYDPGAAERRRAAARREAAARRRRAAARREAAARRRRAALRKKREADRRKRRQVATSAGRITAVVDGDTVKVDLGAPWNREETVRLIGVDSPETSDPDVDVECGGPQATSVMLQISFSSPADVNGDGLLDREGGEGALVQVSTDPTQDFRDAYGRLLGYVDVKDGPPGAPEAGYDLGRTLLGLGWAEVYVFEDVFGRIGPYSGAEHSAAASGAGAWTACGGDFHSED